MRDVDPGPPAAEPWDIDDVRTYDGPDGTIVLGSAANVLEDVARERRGKFDGAIFDPPYNIGVDFREGGLDNFPTETYILNLRRNVDYALDAVKKSGMVMVYGYPEILARLSAKFLIDQQKWLQWFRYDGYTNPKSKLWARTHESILVLWKGPKPKIANLDALRVPYSPGYLERRGGPMGRTGSYRRGDAPNPNPAQRIANPHNLGRLPGDVIYCPTVRRNARKERWFICKTHNVLCAPELAAEHDQCARIKHPAQKPYDLTRHLVLSICKKGRGSILVPYVGSGTECVAAKELGIKFYGAEKDPLYLALATARLKRIGST